MLAILSSFMGPIYNWIRGLDSSIKGIIILSCLLLSFLLLAKSINLGKNHTQKPIKWVCFGFSLILFGVAILFVTV